MHAISLCQSRGLLSDLCLLLKNKMFLLELEMFKVYKVYQYFSTL